MNYDAWTMTHEPRTTLRPQPNVPSVSVTSDSTQRVQPNVPSVSVTSDSTRRVQSSSLEQKRTILRHVRRFGQDVWMEVLRLWRLEIVFKGLDGVWRFYLDGVTSPGLHESL
jgi:hypothetical protein